MKKFGIYIAIVLLVGAFSSCLDDDNNYNYTEVNELQGGIKDFKDNYNIIEGDEITFTPSFNLTIDKENPDVRYEWYVDRVLLKDETGPTFTFKGEKGGVFQVTFVVVDNKTDLRFARSTSVLVISRYHRGWCLLSDEGGRSVLNFIVPTAVHYPVVWGEEEFIRDSLVYHIVERDVTPGLGTNPKGLVNHIGFADYYGDFGLTSFDELVVKQDRWVELNGSTLHHEVYTDEEFRGDIPKDFNPVDANMGYSSKALLDKSGLIYFGKKGDAVDFHANTYVSVGLNNSTKFSRLFQSPKLNRWNTSVILALTEEDNSLVGIVDEGEPGYTSSAISDISSGHCGEVLAITDQNNKENRFKEIKQTIVDGVASPYSANQDVSDASSYWTLLLKDEATSEYQLRYFKLFFDSRIYCPSFNPSYDDSPSYYETSLGKINDYRGMANFNVRRSVVIADGNQLYFYQYGWNPRNNAPYMGEKLKLGNALPDRVKHIVGLDVCVNEGVQMYPFDAQLAVVLENGDLYIYGIRETKGLNDTVESVSLNQVYPNEKTQEKDKNFGNVVDIIYKYGRSFDLFSFTI